MFDVLLPEGANEGDRNKKQKGMTSKGRGVKVHPRSQVDDKAANKRAVRRVSVETTARCNLDRLNDVQTGHVMDREHDGRQTACGHCVVGCRGGRQQNVCKAAYTVYRTLDRAFKSLMDGVDKRILACHVCHFNVSRVHAVPWKKQARCKKSRMQYRGTYPSKPSSEAPTADI
ncbi:hypothetical protein M0657_007056 [Pyricularia oryzae]|uniref:Uncharacterized protein n=1 Tax=Pyricularia oryzae TaxID=318829 RepID=A0A4P7N286_PYROR|nr:hypothetical protein M9X92_007158 [Pyricularia oryzae]KAI7919521.1 hypothetical protein M0657_007056 [Pyricularia oryzae]QBZ56393.1 hypothetical protein PoMZ_01299 [Pyricularia oryzae]